MSVAEIKSSIEDWTEEQRLFATAYLRHLKRKDTVENQLELDRLMDQFGEGKSYSFDQVERMHEALSVEGR